MKKFILGIFLGIVIAGVAIFYVQQEHAQTQTAANTKTEAINKFRKNQTQSQNDSKRQIQNKIAKAANDLMQAQSPQDMLKALDDIIKLRPQDPNLYVLKSQILKKQGNLQGALAEINKAISLDPKNPNFYQVKAEIEFGNKDFEKAERDFTIAAQLSGKADNYYNRAITNLNLGNYQAANLDFKKAQELYKKEGNLLAANQSKDISNFLTQNIPAKPQTSQKTINKISNTKSQNVKQNNAAVNKLIKNKMPQALKHYSESETLKDFQDLLPQFDISPETNFVPQTNSEPQIRPSQQVNSSYGNNSRPAYNSQSHNYHQPNTQTTRMQNANPPVNYAQPIYEQQINTQTAGEFPTDVHQNTLQSQTNLESQNNFGQPNGLEPQVDLLPEDQRQISSDNNFMSQQNISQQNVAMPKITKKDIFKATSLESLHKAENLMGKKDYEGARAVLDSAINRFPQDDKLYYDRALANYFQGNYNDAFNDLDKAIELNPQNSSAAIMKGDMFSSLSQNEQAKQAYKEAERIAADNGNRQGVEEAQTKYQLAEGKEITSKIDPRFQRAANAYAAQDYDTAVDGFSALYTENPTPENAFNLGLAYKGQGNMQKAYEMLSIAADNKQENFEAQMVTAQVAADPEVADYQNAMKYLDRAKEIAKGTGISNPDMWALSAQINSALGDHETAQRNLKIALDGYNQEINKTEDPGERQRISDQIKQIEEYLQQFESN